MAALSFGKKRWRQANDGPAHTLLGWAGFAPLAYSGGRTEDVDRKRIRGGLASPVPVEAQAGRRDAGRLSRCWAARCRPNLQVPIIALREIQAASMARLWGCTASLRMCVWKKRTDRLWARARRSRKLPRRHLWNSFTSPLLFPHSAPIPSLVPSSRPARAFQLSGLLLFFFSSFSSTTSSSISHPIPLQHRGLSSVSLAPPPQTESKAS